MLEGLIPELFGEILGLLDLPDLISLRLASPQLQWRSRAAFGTAAFSEVSTDFSRPNLQWLSSIASCDFRLAVRTLRVGNWSGRWKHDLETPDGDGGYWPRLDSGVLDADSGLAKQFVGVMSLFPNCTGAIITDSRVARHNPLERDDGTPEGNVTPADSVELVLQAYSAPGAPPIQRLHFRIRLHDNWWHPEVLSESTVASAQRACTAHLRELVIEFRPREAYLARMMGLITASPKLRKLILMWHAYPGTGSTPPGYELGRHLDSFPDFAPPLEHLELARMALKETDVLRLLSRCRRTLSTLVFNSLAVNLGSWTSILRHLHDGHFYEVRRISLQRCRSWGNTDILAFCPLWKAQEELQGSCGGTFEFRQCWTTRVDREYHVVGVLFETESEPPAVEAGLQALIEYSHCASGTEGVTPPCADLCEIEKMPQTSLYISTADPRGGRWSSLDWANQG